MKKLNLLKSLFLLCALIVGSSSAWATDVTYVFNSKSWGATVGEDAANWTSGKAGNQMQSGRGVQITTGSTGANATSPESFSNISKIVVTYSTNASSGAGAIKIQVGSGTEKSQNATSTGGTTDRNLTYNFSPEETGKVKMTVTCSANSIYVKSVTITYSAGPVVNVTGVVLDQTEIKLTEGEKTTLTPTISPADATNKSVTWESNDEDVARVSDEGVVTAVAAGTCTITVTTVDGAKTATCNVIVKAIPVAATFDFTSNTWSLPEDVKETGTHEYTSGGKTITLYGPTGNGYYFDTANLNLLLGKNDATLTLPTFDFKVKKIKVYGSEYASGSVTFNIYVGSSAVSTEVSSAQVTHEFIIDAEKQDAGTIYVLKVTNGNNTRISKIEVFGYDNTVEVLAANGYATYVTTHAVEFEEGDAYAVTIEGGVAKLTEVTQVRKNTPVLLKGAGVKKPAVLENAPAAITTDLHVSTGGDPGANAYVLANKAHGVGFYKWNGGSLTSGKVYLQATTPAHEFIGFDGETTGVQELKNSRIEEMKSFYDLMGRKVVQPTKGLYIVNGKKVIIK